MSETQELRDVRDQLFDAKLEALRDMLASGFASITEKIEAGFNHRDTLFAKLASEVEDLRKLRAGDREEFIEYKTKMKVLLAVVGAGSSALGAVVSYVLKTVA